jgi:hypothetical protein
MAAMRDITFWPFWPFDPRPSLQAPFGPSTVLSSLLALRRGPSALLRTGREGFHQAQGFRLSRDLGWGLHQAQGVLAFLHSEEPEAEGLLRRLKAMRLGV